MKNNIETDRRKIMQMLEERNLASDITLIASHFGRFSWISLQEIDQNNNKNLLAASKPKALNPTSLITSNFKYK